MLRFLIVLSLSLLLAGCDGELVSADTWPSNRTIGGEGGSLSLRELLVTIQQGVLDEAISFRVTEEEALIPGGLGVTYRVHPDDLTGLEVMMTWRIRIEDLPQGVYFVDLAVARAEGGEWVPLADTSPDPVAGQVSGVTDGTGVFTLIQLSELP